MGHDELIHTLLHGGSPTTAEVSPTDSRILDATISLVSAHGPARTTIDDIAARAGVSRMTLFRRFGTKEEITAAALDRELQRLLTDLSNRAAATTTAKQCATAAFEWVLEIAWSHPYVTRLSEEHVDILISFWRDHEPSWHHISTQLLAGLLQNSDLRDPLTPAAAEHVAEMLVRLSISYAITAPVDAPSDQTAWQRVVHTTIDLLQLE